MFLLILLTHWTRRFWYHTIVNKLRR
uniref:Uncharacterized protein n=1 Tax=Arundo donax TaxID=35708 RepID=A0A0A9C7N1_ARUDO